MTRYALVPVEATEEMELAALTALASYRQRIADELKAAGFEKIAPVAMTSCGSADFDAVYPVAIAASPGQGAVTAEQLEAAARAHYEEHASQWDSRIEWADLPAPIRAQEIKNQRAALFALGLTVQP